MNDGKITPDHPPRITNASYLFAWKVTAFLIALILLALAIPSEPPPSPVGSKLKMIRRGGAVYDGEGCANCHSMMVRGIDRGMGITATDDLMYARSDYPGSVRIGTDLQNIAGRYPKSLMEIRLTDPNALHPGTVMPSYAHLSDTRRAQLIEFLERSALIPGGLEAIRAMNSIEAAVPDEVVISMYKYLDSETGLIITPLESSPELMIAASGIYNSRCAVCHGITGRGDGPFYSQGNRPGAASPLIPPKVFTSEDFRDITDIKLYWRIMEGVPGTGMPSWGGTLSEDAIWLLVKYVRLLIPTNEPFKSEGISSAGPGDETASEDDGGIEEGEESNQSPGIPDELDSDLSPGSADEITVEGGT